ncbi:MAG: hypothetical protein Q4D43_11540, partial [Clostridia bacterium]|nr:hypothetical protein [Clostridia bacterium]
FSANTPVFGQDILVKMQRDDNMIALRTYSRKGGARGRLLIFADALQAWLDGDRERPFYDADCGNFLILRLYGGFCKMQLFWLSEYSNGDLHGIRQNVEIPENRLLTLMQDGTPVRYLSKPQTCNVRIDAVPSAKVIITPAPAAARIWIPASTATVKNRRIGIFMSARRTPHEVF